LRRAARVPDQPEVISVTTFGEHRADTRGPGFWSRYRRVIVTLVVIAIVVAVVLIVLYAGGGGGGGY
jgi:hypothetical protein